MHFHNEKRQTAISSLSPISKAVKQPLSIEAENTTCLVYQTVNYLYYEM